MSVSFDTTALQAELRKLRIDLANAAYHAMRECVDEAAKAARDTKLFKDSVPLRPDRLVHLRETIRGETTSATTGEISANAGHARFIESGTAPHWIPNSGGLPGERGRGAIMRFEVNGNVFFRSRVFHPRVAARPFMERAGEYGEYILAEKLEEFSAIAIYVFNA